MGRLKCPNCGGVHFRSVEEGVRCSTCNASFTPQGLMDWKKKRIKPDLLMGRVLLSDGCAKAYTFLVQPMRIQGVGAKSISLLGTEPIVRLHELISDAFRDETEEIVGWDDDTHLHCFDIGKTEDGCPAVRYGNMRTPDSSPSLSRVIAAMYGMDVREKDDYEFSISTMPIQVGKPFKYVFDFGDNNEFQVVLLKIEEPGGQLPRIIDVKTGKVMRVEKIEVGLDMNLGE